MISKTKTHNPEQQPIIDEILEGLFRHNDKYISSKFFYDQLGSELFEQICKLDEYYLTRCEIDIFKKDINNIKAKIHKNTLVIELGAGSIHKIKFILENIKNIIAYFPVDISRDFLIDQVSQLKNIFRDLIVAPVIVDYTNGFFLPNIKNEFEEILVFYPGSSIGNFHPLLARDILENIFTIIKMEYPNKPIKLLLGVDLIKDKLILEKAYNDTKGITKDFNLNILNHINNISDANFDLGQWSHYAFYNDKMNRIEMHLISSKDQEVNINDHKIKFCKNEAIRTEYSYKYSKRILESLFHGFLEIEEFWTDSKNCYAVVLAKNS